MPRPRDLYYAASIGVASAITYCLMAFVILPALHRPGDSVGTLWAVISTIFVFRDTRARSLSAGGSRLLATAVSFTLCLLYLLLFPANAVAMILLIAIGAVLMMLLGRRDDISVISITTAVIVIDAVSKPQDAWQQPLLRLTDTAIGIAVGIACKLLVSLASDDNA